MKYIYIYNHLYVVFVVSDINSEFVYFLCNWRAFPYKLSNYTENKQIQN